MHYTNPACLRFHLQLSLVRNTFNQSSLRNSECLKAHLFVFNSFMSALIVTWCSCTCDECSESRCVLQHMHKGLNALNTWTFLSAVDSKWRFATNKAGRTRVLFFANCADASIHWKQYIVCVEQRNCTAQIYCYRGGPLVTHACKTRLYLLCKNSLRISPANHKFAARPGRFFQLLLGHGTKK